MNCPIDGEVLLISERQGIEIDYCPKCRGVWLDRGELDKLIEASDRSYGRDRDDDDRYREQKPRRDDRSDDDRSDRERSYKEHKKKKPSSFLSEIFEFGG